MNKQVLKFGLTRAVILAGLVGTLSFSTFAAAKTSKNKEKETASAVQYVGTSDKGIVFNVKYDNANAAPFSLIIKNEFGDVVFQQQYSDTAFDKTILFSKEPGEAHLTFMIKSPSANIKQTFDISTSTRTVEDVVVKSAE